MTEDNPNILNTELQVEPEIQTHLMATAAWAKVTAVTGFIISVLIIFFAYFFAKQLSRPSYFYTNRSLSTAEQVTVAIYIVTAVVHAVLSFLQYRFANNIQVALRSTDQFALTNAFQTLKVFAIIRGIVAVLTVILLALVVIAMAVKQ